MTTLTLAHDIATKAHAGQTRKFSGIPYITHPEAVAAAMTDDDLKAAALLHDVIEDTDYTAERLLAEGIPASIVGIVVALTRRSDETHREMIVRISRDPKATAVKIADVRHNKSTTPADSTMHKRYATALEILTAAK